MSTSAFVLYAMLRRLTYDSSFPLVQPSPAFDLEAWTVVNLVCKVCSAHVGGNAVNTPGYCIWGQKGGKGDFVAPIRDNGPVGASLDPNWPGLDGDDKQIKFDKDKLIKAADTLEGALSGITALQAPARVTAAHVGNWDAGRALAATIGSGQESLARVEDDLLRKIRTVIVALRETASRYQRADEDTEVSARSLGAESGDSSPTPTSKNAPYAG